MKKTELVGLDAMQDLLELTIWTAYVAEERIVSLLIVGKPETGRTELLKKYRALAGIIPRDKFTARGILEELMNGTIDVLFDGREKILGHIMVYEFSGMLSYKPSSVEQTISFLDALTEEGLGPQSSYWIKGHELDEYVGLKGGIIGLVNTANFFNKAGKVKSIFYEGGWFSRNLVWSFDESSITTARIFESFEKGEYQASNGFVNKIHLKLPDRRKYVSIPIEIKKKITELSEEIALGYNEDLEDTRVKIKGKRIWKSIASLVKASALRAGSANVIEEDFERIEYLSKWFNLKLKPLKEEYPFRSY
jgi:hypothetical protein